MREPNAAKLREIVFASPQATTEDILALEQLLAQREALAAAQEQELVLRRIADGEHFHVAAHSASDTPAMIARNWALASLSNSAPTTAETK